MVKTKKQLKSIVVKNMKTMGTYKKEFDQIIDIYAGMLYQYLFFEDELEGMGYRITEDYTNKAGATNQRKVPLLTAMESLRKDIISYSDRLTLNPKSININLPDKEDEGSPLDRFLAPTK